MEYIYEYFLEIVECKFARNGLTNWKSFLTNILKNIIWHLFAGESHQVVKITVPCYTPSPPTYTTPPLFCCNRSTDYRWVFFYKVLTKVIFCLLLHGPSSVTFNLSISQFKTFLLHTVCYSCKQHNETIFICLSFQNIMEPLPLLRCSFSY